MIRDYKNIMYPVYSYSTRLVVMAEHIMECTLVAQLLRMSLHRIKADMVCSFKKSFSVVD